MNLSVRYHLSMAAAYAVGAVAAVWVGVRLDDHAVPLSLLLLSAGGVFAWVFDLAADVVYRTNVVTHTCPDCGLTVRLTGAACEEAERWRERTADHPHH